MTSTMLGLALSKEGINSALVTAERRGSLAAPLPFA
jgi:hypothetical protein